MSMCLFFNCVCSYTKMTVSALVYKTAEAEQKKKRSKIGDPSRGGPEGSLFNSYNTEV